MTLEQGQLEGARWAPVVQGAVRRRAMRSAGRGRPARPVIVKAISAVKSQASVRAMVRYVARLGQQRDGAPMKDPLMPDLVIADARPVVRDETGRRLTDAELRRLHREWDLIPDDQNTTRRPRASTSTPSDREAGLRHVQVRHYVLSAPIEQEEQIGALERAAGDFALETFGAWGHRCVWTMHREHAYPHVHLLVKAAADEEPEDDGRPSRRRRLRSDRAGLFLDGLRESWAERCRRHGLAVDASRIADRPEEVKAILEFRRSPPESPPSRRALERRQVWSDEDAARSSWAELADRAPNWWATHGDRMLQRQVRRDRSKGSGRRPVDDLPWPWLVQGDASPEPTPSGWWDRVLSGFAPPLGTSGPARGALERELDRRMVWTGPGGSDLGAPLNRFLDLGSTDPELAVRLLVEVPQRFGRANPGADPDRQPPPEIGLRHRQLAAWRRRRRAVLGTLGMAALRERADTDEGQASSPGPEARLRTYLRVTGLFVDPTATGWSDGTDAALASWRALRREAPDLADWYMARNPAIFGTVSRIQSWCRRDPELGRRISSVPSPTPVAVSRGSNGQRVPAPDGPIRQAGLMAGRETARRRFAACQEELLEAWRLVAEADEGWDGSVASALERRVAELKAQPPERSIPPLVAPSRDEPVRRYEPVRVFRKRNRRLSGIDYGD